MTKRTVELPFVDLSEPGGGDALRRGLFETGFFLLADHVIPRSLLDGVRESTRTFLKRPDTEKGRFEGPMRGWSAFGAESATAGYGIEGEDDAIDACEKYSMGAIVTPDMLAQNPSYFGAPEAAWYFGENLFPDDAMRQRWEEYYERMQRLGARLVDAARSALGLPSGAWEAFSSLPPSVLRFLAYPDHGEGIRMGAHFDDTLMSILHQSVPENGFAALQVQLPGEDEWRAVTPADDVFVVNVGEALSFLSGGRIVATKHRVMGPPDGNAKGSARTSIGHFYLPNWNARLRPSLAAPTNARSTAYDNPDIREPDGSVLHYKLQQRQVDLMTGKA